MDTQEYLLKKEKCLFIWKAAFPTLKLKSTFVRVMGLGGDKEVCLGWEGYTLLVLAAWGQPSLLLPQAPAMQHPWVPLPGCHTPGFPTGR